MLTLLGDELSVTHYLRFILAAKMLRTELVTILPLVSRCFLPLLCFLTSLDLYFNHETVERMDAQLELLEFKSQLCHLQLRDLGNLLNLCMPQFPHFKVGMIIIPAST